MADIVSISLGTAQIIVQIGAVYLAFRLSKVTGAFQAWSLVIFPLILMTVRRVTPLMIEMGSIAALAGTIAYVDASFFR